MKINWRKKTWEPTKTHINQLNDLEQDLVKYAVSGKEVDKDDKVDRGDTAGRVIRVISCTGLYWAQKLYLSKILHYKIFVICDIFSRKLST